MISRRRRWLLGLIALLGVGVLLGGPYLLAWRHFRAGESALERYHGEEALQHLTRYLQVFPNSVKGHLLASRAARRAEDADTAELHLRQAKRLHPDESPEISLEWALLRVSLGDLEENEAYVLERAQNNPAEWELVQEALSMGYTRLYRITDALRCLDRWLTKDPDNVQALFLRGNLWWQVQRQHWAVPDYRRVVELDPEHHEARWRLARCLVQGGGYDEALPLLEETLARRPDDPEVLVYLARCEHMAGHPDRAREILDGVLQEHPENDLALRTRGQLALLSGQPAEAEKWLRRAVRAAANDYQSSWALAQAIRQQGREAEANTQMERADELKDRTSRLGEILTRLMAQKPHDPALQAELGALLIELGHAKVGENWLLSALNLDPRCGAAHAALAKYYQQRGDAERAAFHRRQAPALDGRK